jgi:PmbA protein
MELPGAAPTTLFLQPSTRTPEEILNMVEGGFRITELMGLHTLDPVTGEFSLGAGGQRIRSGRAEGPVAGIGLAGSIQGLFGGITAVGADLRLFPGNVAGSTILARGLSISGS